jgi:hypothetical protein
VKTTIALLAILAGCAQHPTYPSRTYYPSLSSYGYSRPAAQQNTNLYWMYSGGRLTPIIQSGPIVMPIRSLGFR